ncbi:hypothetical protein OA958_01085 [Bacteroidota bacterium]|nr:hypothetical protein [Bacteroidota bacterium]
MKETIKNSLIGAFAIFGFVALISSSNTTPTVIHEMPESHVWSMPFEKVNQNGFGHATMFNRVTGEVRLYRLNSMEPNILNRMFYIKVPEKKTQLFSE